MIKARLTSTRMANVILLLMIFACALITAPSANFLPFYNNFIIKVLGLFLLGLFSGAGVIYGFQKHRYWLTLFSLILLIFAHSYLSLVIACLGAWFTDFHLQTNPKPWRKNLNTIIVGALLCGIITTLIFFIGIVIAPKVFHNSNALWGILFLFFIFPGACLAGALFSALRLLVKNKKVTLWLYRILIIIAILACSYFLSSHIGITLFFYFFASGLLLSYLAIELYQNHQQRKSHPQC